MNRGNKFYYQFRQYDLDEPIKEPINSLESKLMNKFEFDYILGLFMPYGVRGIIMDYCFENKANNNKTKYSNIFPKDKISSDIRKSNCLLYK